MSLLRVLPSEQATLDDLRERRYDAVLASLGFEYRCREIPAALAPAGSRYAIPFEDHTSDADYALNKQWFDGNGWEQPAVGEAAFASWVFSWLEGLNDEADGPLRLAVDISSMSRPRMAGIVEALLSLPRRRRIEVDFLYTPAKFEPPRPASDPHVFDVAPVTPYFAGWWSDLEAPLWVLIGVGYELELASSAIDALEPAKTEAYVPQGDDERYLDKIKEANAALLDYPGALHLTTFYAVSNPFACFRQLESRLEQLTPAHRIALVPLGPKIFAVCAMLAAALHPAATQIIRVSAGARQLAVNRYSDGNVYGLTAVVGPSRDEEETAA